MTEVTPYSTDVLGLPYWKIVLETRRRAPVAFNKNAYFTFPDPTGQVIYKVTYDDRGNGYISLNGGEDMALTAQERFIIIKIQTESMAGSRFWSVLDLILP